MSTDEPRVASLQPYSFNFTVSAEARVRALVGGPPAWALRRKRMDRRLEDFWAAVEARYRALWIAAGEGRIHDDGRESRHALLDVDGRDARAARDHERRLFRQRVDPEQWRVEHFNLAWDRHLGRCGLELLAAEVEEFNRVFPIEANLAVDPASERFLWMGRPWEHLAPPTRPEVLDRFPFRAAQNV